MLDDSPTARIAGVFAVASRGDSARVGFQFDEGVVVPFALFFSHVLHQLLDSVRVGNHCLAGPFARLGPLGLLKMFFDTGPINTQSSLFHHPLQVTAQFTQRANRLSYIWTSGLRVRAPSKFEALSQRDSMANGQPPHDQVVTGQQQSEGPS